MSRDIKVLHLESTDVCQAACPACSRETDILFNKSIKNHLTLDKIKQHINEHDIVNLQKMFMCGVYGDPAAGKHTLDIYRYFRKINPEICLGMNTNGAIQNTSWWTTLGDLFSKEQDYVVFSIDGLEDTNHVYRRGVDWNKLIENARAYISTGASAHWDMLIFRHNEHQVQDCERLAKKLGFKWFRAKVSKRDLPSGIEQPIGFTLPAKRALDIHCHALREQSAYIDARGNLWPCCWIGATTSDCTVDIESLQESWTSKVPNKICLRTCGQSEKETNFSAQWRWETKLS